MRPGRSRHYFHQSLSFSQGWRGGLFLVGGAGWLFVAPGLLLFIEEAVLDVGFAVGFAGHDPEDGEEHAEGEGEGGDHGEGQTVGGGEGHGNGGVEKWGALGLLEEAAHGDEVGELEAVLFEELLGSGTELVGEEGDALELFLLSEVDDVLEDEGAVALFAMIGMDDDILHEDDESAEGGGDGEEEVDHADDAFVVAEDEDAAAAGFLEDEADAAVVGLVIGGEVALEIHEFGDEVDEGGEVLDGGRFDADGGAGGVEGSRCLGHSWSVAVPGGVVRWKFGDRGKVGRGCFLSRA